MSERYLEIVEIASGEVVHRVDVSSKSDRALDRVFEGLLMKTNTERFFIRDTDSMKNPTHWRPLPTPPKDG